MIWSLIAMSVLMAVDCQGEGAKLAFSRIVGASSEVLILDRSDGSLTRVTSTPEVEEWSPVWSADGSMLAWLRASGAAGDIVIADVAGRQIEEIDHLPLPMLPSRSIGEASRLSWSVSGQKFAYADDNFDLVLVDRETQEAKVLSRELSPHRYWTTGGEWSQDGAFLYWVSFGIYRIEFDGTSVEVSNLRYPGSGISIHGPTGRVAYATEAAFLICDEGPCDYSAPYLWPQVLYMESVDSVNLQFLTTSATTKAHCTWDRGGESILYAELGPSGSWDVMSVTLDGTVSQLIGGPADDFYPAVEPYKTATVISTSCSWGSVKKSITCVAAGG